MYAYHPILLYGKLINFEEQVEILAGSALVQNN